MTQSPPPRQDMRRYKRLQSFKSALLVTDSQEVPIPVRILDMSTAGAKLELRAPADPPAKFRLVIRADSPEDRKSVRCQRLWQQNERLGVRFC